MAEYINRDAVHDLVRSLTKYAWASPVRNEQRVTVDADDVQFGVDKIPSADVAPVRHGYWRPILHKDGKTDYECSCCLGIIMDVPDDDEHDLCAWCSMCGAKMDLEG